MEFQVYFKEKLYLALIVIVNFFIYRSVYNIIKYGLQPVHLVIAIYATLLIAAVAVASLWFVGHLRGNAIRVSAYQFPEIYEILKNQSAQLELLQTPDLYILQGNGIINAFALRFCGRNYIVLHSNVLEAAFEEGMPAVEFIIGHELGHIKRNHSSLFKSLFLFPAKLIPFLGSAYSRACEYTCDNIGYHLSPLGAEKGLLILAAGKKLYKKIDSKAVLHNAHIEPGFAVWFAEITSTHPHLTSRLAAVADLQMKTLK